MAALRVSAIMQNMGSLERDYRSGVIGRSEYEFHRGRLERDYDLAMGYGQNPPITPPCPPPPIFSDGGWNSPESERVVKKVPPKKVSKKPKTLLLLT